MSEKKYIELEEAKRVMESNDWLNPAIPNVVNVILDRLPAADVVEVVRCKDCQHRAIVGRAPFAVYVCTHEKGLGDNVKDTDFCSYGERREQK